MDIMMIGNDIIEKALAAVHENANQDTVMALIHALQDRLVADGHLLLPVDHPDPDNTDTFRLRTVLAENGLVVWPEWLAEHHLWHVEVLLDKASAHEESSSAGT